MEKRSQWTTPSKWILAGEHAVLRGGDALVFPLFAKSMYWDYAASSENLKVSFNGETAQELEMIFGFVLDKACEISGIEKRTLTGQLKIKSEILFGMGLGASASLSVGLARLFQSCNCSELNEIQLAQKIETFFHGESSGVDVAVVAHQKPLIYKRNSRPVIIDKYRLPHLALSHCGRRGPTKECVEKVKALFVSNPKAAAAIDSKMNESVQNFKKLLIAGTESEWIDTLSQAHSCFEDWDLIPKEASDHIELLKSAGALACKMTGSGGGGYILSLWKHPADYSEIKTMIPLDQNRG